jgi:hypothetical protein
LRILTGGLAFAKWNPALEGRFPEGLMTKVAAYLGRKGASVRAHTGDLADM